MKESVNVKNIGLRGVTVADTKVSFIDGNKDVLVYRGYRIEDLAQNASFPEVAYLLLHETLPDNIEEKTGEAQVKPALYRPKAEYIGQYCGLMGCKFDPLETR
ncbi:MAG: citrate/2-methylcitrate synthase [Thermodesulfobacteriota bacterium]|nr:citrate/2-methylcitrate synthase [Thermodesulfobacteriota bacterium]